MNYDTDGKKRRTQKHARKSALSTENNTNGERLTRVLKYKNRRKKQRRAKILKGVLKICLVLSFCAAILGVGYFAFLIKGKPDLILSELDNDMQVSYVYDRNGEEIAMLSGSEKRIKVRLDEVPQDLVDAYVSMEDKRFYTHNGVDVKGVLNAIIGQLTGKSSRGGSTITQQLIKNTYLSSERTYKRKAQEMVLALELERRLSKDEILEYYLNKIFMGENNYGVEAAALDYFGKHIGEVTLKEAACIVGMTASPNGYNPRTHYDRFLERGNLVLAEMYEDEKISADEYYLARQEEPVIADEYFDRGLYPYTSFIDFTVKSAAKDLLAKEHVAVNATTLNQAEFRIRTGGYKIYTTLDPQQQSDIQQVVANYPYAEDYAECSAAVIEHSTGEIVVLIPGREENTVMDGFNRAVDSRQAIGSTAKPIFVYAPFIDLGADTDTIVDDTRTKIQGWNTEQGYPNGDITNSRITLRYAVETSRNIAAARTLMENVGIDTAYEYLVSMGVDGSHTSRSPAGMGLGADGFTTLEIAGAYATLANDGVYLAPHAYREITDMYDNTVLIPDLNRHRVFSSETAFMITDVLHTTMTNGYGVNANLDWITTAGKTGTHEDKAVTMAGYTHYYTCFLRISSDDDTPIKDTSYYNSAGLWKQVMTRMHYGLEDAPIQTKTFDELNIVWYGGEYRHWTDKYYSKYVYPQPAAPTEHQVCDEWGNCWTEWW